MPGKRIESVTLDQLASDGKLVAKLARRKGGVNVVNDAGRVIFRLTIPSTPLPD